MSCAETFLSSYGKAFVQTTQKLVCFLPQFVNRMLWVGFNRCSFSLLGIHPPAEWCYQVGKGQKLRVLKSRNEFSEFCILLQCSCYAVVYLIHSCSRNAWVTVWVNLPWCSSHEPFEKLVHHPNEQSAYIIPFPIQSSSGLTVLVNSHKGYSVLPFCSDPKSQCQGDSQSQFSLLALRRTCLWGSVFLMDVASETDHLFIK